MLVVYFGVIETRGRTLEEIDMMYVQHVRPWKSKDWIAPQNEWNSEDQSEASEKIRQSVGHREEA